MEFCFCSCWIYLWMVIVLFRNILADPDTSAHYTIHKTPDTFDQAMEACSSSILTTLTTHQEVTHILGLVSRSVSPLNQSEFIFWVGLRKGKKDCVVPTLPLRGFKWTEDGSEQSEVNSWTEEPPLTCTGIRCAALKVEFDGSAVTRWGLISLSCKTSYPFICKLRDSLTGGAPEPPKPEPVTPEPPKPEPVTPEPKPATSEPHKPKPRPTTQKLEPTAHKPERPTQGPELGTDPKFTTQPKLLDHGPSSEPASGSDSCQSHLLTGFRSLSPDPNNSSRIQVECWSTVQQMELHCSGSPAMWRLLNGSPASFTTVCQKCDDGFLKDASGDCVDIDECTNSPCKYLCLNTEGSYNCFCTDENGEEHEENSTACMATPINDGSSMLSGILIPALIAVAALVVLVVIVAVTVKCCLMRRSKKRAMKKAEKMAMKNKDGTDLANEKAAA